MYNYTFLCIMALFSHYFNLNFIFIHNIHPILPHPTHQNSIFLAQLTIYKLLNYFLKRGVLKKKILKMYIKNRVATTLFLQLLN